MNKLRKQATMLWKEKHVRIYVDELRPKINNKYVG